MSNEITLRAFEKEDIEFIHSLLNNPEIMSFWFSEAYRPKVTIEEDFDKTKDSEDIRRFVLQKGNERLGIVQLFAIDHIHRKAEFAIMIDQVHQGQGYAATATQLAIDYSFNKLNLHKFFLIVDEVNEKAVHIYEQAGFKAEAVLKDEFFVNGSYHNIIIMSIFEDEYFDNKA